MTRRSKKRRLPEPCAPERSAQIPSGTAARIASGSATRARRPFSLLAVCGLLVLAVFAVFGQTAAYDFINLDDPAYVSENRNVSEGLTGKGIAWAVTARHSGNWHPLTWLSHMLDCQLYHLKPGGHHLTSVFLHAAAAVLLFLALRRMTAAPWPSAWTATVFAIHPLRVESVAWVAERKDVLSGLLFMLTLWFYARYAQRPGYPCTHGSSWGRYLLVLVSFALGLAAKPMLVTLPFVLLLLDYWPLGRMRRAGSEEQGVGSGEQGVGSGERGANNAPSTSFPRLLVEKIPLFILAAASCVVTLAAQHYGMPSLEQMSFAGRVANAVVAYVAYLGKMLCPAGLAVLYPLSKDPLPAWEVVAAVSVLLAIFTVVFAARRKCPYLLVGWLWYLGTLVPVIGLVQVGDQAMADRYTYLTQIGLAMAIAWGAADVARSWLSRRWPLAAVAAVTLAALMVCAWQQARHWRDSQALWVQTLACTSQNAVAHNGLGSALAGRGRLDEALAHYRTALEINPDLAIAHNNLGFALAGRGQVDEAIAHLQRALEIRPDDAEAHYNLGTVLAGRGQVEKAIAHYRKALEINPDDAEVHNNLGAMLAASGQADEAIAHYRKALEIKPDDAEVHNNLGLALAGRGQVDEAVAHYGKALEIQPDYVRAHYNLGLALAGRGQVDEALAHYQKALGLAASGNDRALADAIRARIRSLQPAAPGGN